MPCGFVSFFNVHAYGSLSFVKKKQRRTHSSPWYILYIRQSMRYLNTFLQCINFNALDNSSEGDLTKIPRLIITALFVKLIGVLYLFYTQFLTFHYSISREDIWMSNASTSEIHCGVLLALIITPIPCGSFYTETIWSVQINLLSIIAHASFDSFTSGIHEHSFYPKKA